MLNMARCEDKVQAPSAAKGLKNKLYLFIGLCLVVQLDYKLEFLTKNLI